MKEYLALFDKDIFDMNFTEIMASLFGVLVVFTLLFIIIFIILKIYFFFQDLQDMRKEFLKNHIKNLENE